MTDPTLPQPANDPSEVFALSTPTIAEMASGEWEPPKIPLNLFALCAEDGRKGFLRELYNIGYPALFEGVHHVWNSLCAPRAYRCTLMGVHSGAGGGGKLGLVNTLRHFITEALATIHPIPLRSGYDSLEEWHQAAMATYDDDERDLQIVIVRYAAILNGYSSEV
jgi:hypothetical protein